LVQAIRNATDDGSELVACTRISLSGRIVHDLRRSGVRHLIHAGVDPHTVMEFSGHRTPSMLKRYHIIALEDLCRAAERGSAYDRERKAGTVVLFPTTRE
jgi:integrase